jgi:hypothetical protein
MKKMLFALMVLSLLTLSPWTVQAQEKGKRKKGNASPEQQMIDQFMKQLEKAEMTEDQSTKIKELWTKIAKEVTKTRTEGGITSEILKKRSEVTKEAREAGKKQKEVQEAVDKALALNDAQKKVMQETEAQLSKVRIEIGKLLKPEQIEKLSPQTKDILKEKEGRKKKKA